MLCHCTTNTLRLFLRNVAQVDLPSSAKYVSRRSFKSSSISHSSPAFRSQRQFSRRGFSSASSLLEGQASAERSILLHSRDGDVQETQSVERDTVVSKQTTDDSAFAEFSLDAIDEILAESRTDTPIADGLADPVMVDDGSPASFVASSFSKQREVRERKGKAKDLIWRPSEDQRSPLHTQVVKTPKEERGNSEDTRNRTETRAPQQYATFPRLPRINLEVIDRTPLKSRIPKDEPVRNYAGGREWIPREKEHWQIDKESRIKKYPEGWKPQKRLSPDAISGIRALHAQLPEEYNTRKLAETFEVSPEAISRILRTHWSPSSEEEEDRTRRWLKRGESVWSRYAEAGVKPPKKWRDAGVGNGKLEWMKNDRPKRREAGPTPALVTQPRRPGGLYQLGGKRHSSGSEGGFI